MRSAILTYTYRSVYIHDMGEPGKDSARRILSTALELFSKNGFDATGVHEVADKAKVAKPTIYYFFKSKEGLYKAVWERCPADFFAQLEQKSRYRAFPRQYDKDIFPQLCEIAALYAQLAKKQKSFFRLARCALFVPNDSGGAAIAQAFYKKQQTLLENFFSEAAKSHGNLQGKSDQLARTFLVLVYTAVSVEPDAAAIVKQFLHGIFA